MKELTSYINHDNGRKLFFRTWHPENGNTKATVLVVHGYAEHSGRYKYTAQHLTDSGYGVYSIDLYGHGKSDGKRGDVPKFETFTNDLYKLYTIAKNKEKNDIFILGHSMGGAIAVHFAIIHPNALKGMVVSGAGIRVTADVPEILKKISSFIAVAAPLLPVTSFDIEGISRDQEVVKNYLNDPLNYTGKVRARMGRELLRVEKLTTPAALSKIEIPALILHGGDDRIVSPECSRIIFESISSRDKKLDIIPGLYHEILNSAKKKDILEQITGWLGEHTG